MATKANGLFVNLSCWPPSPPISPALQTITPRELGDWALAAKSAM